MIADLDLLELELRQLPGVSAVAFDDADDDAMIVQLVLSDPLTAAAVAARAELLAARRLEVRTRVEVRRAGAPLLPPAFETEIEQVPGVRSCTAERGSRGEMRKVTVSIENEDAVATVRGRLTTALGGAIADDRLVFELRHRDASARH